MDLHTVQVRLDRPYPAFLGALAQVYLGMASPTAFKKWGRDEYERHLAGTGPFRFVAEQYVPGKTIVLEKNQDYNWGPASYRRNPPLYFGSGHDPDSSCQKTHLIHDHTGPAYLDRVIFVSIPDPSARASSLETGAVDAVDELSPAAAARLKKERHYWITADGTTFHGASRTVNCLAYDAHGLSPFLYDAAFR
jgi:peptide/nickel transport system substrate-binding protein